MMANVLFQNSDKRDVTSYTAQNLVQKLICDAKRGISRITRDADMFPSKTRYTTCKASLSWHTIFLEIEQLAQPSLSVTYDLGCQTIRMYMYS